MIIKLLKSSKKGEPLYEDNDFIVTCSNTSFDKFVIYCNPAAGLNRVGIHRVITDKGRPGKPIYGIYAPLGINEINFFCKTANWYQRDSIDHCITAIKDKIRGFEKNTVIYGSSMGGFGALNFGPELGITSIALSPQVTLAKEFDIAPDWNEVLQYTIQRNGAFKSNIIDGKCKHHRCFVFYDSGSSLDVKHAEYIEKHLNNCTMLELNNVGHGLGLLNKIYPFKRIVVEILNDTFDKNIFYKQVNSELDKVIPWKRKELSLCGINFYTREKYETIRRHYLLGRLFYSCKKVKEKKTAHWHFFSKGQTHP